MKFNQRYKIQQKDNCNRKLTDAQVLQIYEEHLSSVDIIHTITADIREHKLTIYHLNICKDVTKFYHLIYDNANFWLKRKRDKFIGNTEVTIEPKNLIAP